MEQPTVAEVPEVTETQTLTEAPEVAEETQVDPDRPARRKKK